MSQRARRRQRKSRVRRQEDPARLRGRPRDRSASPPRASALWVLDVAPRPRSIDELKPIDKGANSVVFAADGTRLGYVQTDVLREPVELDEIPKVLQHATIAIEDENFYEHDGVDYAAIVRAAVENIEAGEVKQGGSTITQQLVRNLYIADPEDTIERKIRRGQAGREYEEEHTKKRDPRAVPEHRLLRHQRRPHRGRRRGRLAGLLQQARLGPQPRRGGAARRAAAGALRVQPVPQPGGREAAPQPGARRDGRAGLHQRRRRRGGEGRRPRPRARLPLRADARSPTSSTSSSRS